VQLSAPTDICVADYNDTFYVIDDNDHIDRFLLDGSFLDTVVPAATLPDPLAIAVTYGLPTNYLFVVQIGSSSVYRFNLDGSEMTELRNNTIVTAIKDIYVTDYIYTVLQNDSVWRWELSGTPISPGVEDVPAVNNSREIAVFDLDGGVVTVLRASLSDYVWAADVNEKLYVADRANGLVIENVGTTVKFVTEFGVSDTFLI
jgi:hypothetical protein